MGGAMTPSRALLEGLYPRAHGLPISMTSGYRVQGNLSGSQPMSSNHNPNPPWGEIHSVWGGEYTLRKVYFPGGGSPHTKKRRLAR